MEQITKKDKLEGYFDGFLGKRCDDGSEVDPKNPKAMEERQNNSAFQKDSSSPIASNYEESDSASESDSSSSDYVDPTLSSEEIRKMIDFCKREISQIKKEIMLPEYIGNANSSSSATQVGSFDISESHFQHEVIERRIQMDEDSSHHHPALSTKILREEGLPNITDEEKVLKSTYEQKEEENVLPSFWEPRPYDYKYKKLSNEESDHLTARIYSTIYMKNQPKPKLTVKKSVKQQNKIEIKQKIPKEKEEKKQKVKIMKFAENKYGITKLRYSS